jgi:hypothetical protein
MKINRRNLLMSTLFGAGYVGLRSLATGIPAAVLLGGTRALADTPAGTCADASKAQYIIMSTSFLGDPLNANAPGTYATSGALASISHNPDTTLMPATPLTINGQSTTAAKPWATTAAGGVMTQNVLDRMTVWHMMTNTPVHPREPDVLQLLGATAPTEMLPSLLAKQLAPCLGTVQAQPITLGASNPSEGLSAGGQALPIIPPLALKATLANPAGPLLGVTNLQMLRDQTLSKLDDIYRGPATQAQKAYIDSLIVSQTQLRSIKQELLNALSSIKDNSVASQITAAIVLIRMNVTPVIAIHIPFGGDNHTDAGLAGEAAQTVSGIGSIASLMTQLQDPANANANGSLFDQVSFISLNVFGRTLGPSYTNGRNHNQNHQVSLTIGKPFAGGIIGGVGPVGTDFGCLSINSTTGAGGGDIDPDQTLASFGKTVMTGVGVDSAFVNSAVTSGKVVKAALT